MKDRLILDGLHQYAMHLYSTLVKGGLSELQAKSEVTRLLLLEANTFGPVSVYPELEKSLEIILERKLTEQERFKLNHME